MSLIDRVFKSSTPIPGSMVIEAPKVAPEVEIGVTGLLRTSGPAGYVFDEFLAALSTYRAKQVYREMRDNDAVIGSMFFALEMILRRAEWRVEAAPGAKGKQYGQFLEQCLEDCSHTWEDFVAECVSMFAFGFALFETVYKRRQGQDPGTETDADGDKTQKPSSKYDDGLIGWRKFAPRAQESVLYWSWDKQGGLQGAVQLAAPEYKTVSIPIERLLLFRTTSLKQNPEGRALDPETPIPTPGGWKTLDDMSPGDPLFDEQGKISQVVARQEWENRPCYRVTFSDHTSIVADANHLWVTKTMRERRKGLPARVRTTEELSRRVKAGGGKTNNHCIGWTKPLEYPEEPLPLDPYYLGYWLGDGSKRESVIACDRRDAIEISGFIESAGYRTMARVEKHSGGCQTLAVGGMVKGSRDGPHSILKRMGLLHNKHIPDSYLHGSVTQRLMLLAGLMDSDGDADANYGQCKFTNTNQQLVKGVAELVRSLGVTARTRLSQKAGFKRNTLDLWEVHFRPPWSPFRIQRKTDRTKDWTRLQGNYIASVEPVTPRRTVCIETSASSHLFLAGEAMVPTHNSLLRNCYRPWFMKRRIEEVEGIGIERDLCGIPILHASAEALAQMGGQNAAQQLVRNIRVDDQMGVVLPIAYDDKGNKLVELELLKTAGGKQTDPSATIARYNADMLNTVLAGFVQFGQGPTGSRALHMSATQIFSLAIGTVMDSVAAVMNRFAIPRLMAMNKMDQKFAPKMKAGEIGVRDLEELADFVQKLSAGGLTFFDKPTANYLRKAARLPEEPEGDESGPAQPPAATPPPKKAPANAAMPKPTNPSQEVEEERLEGAV